MTISNEKLMAYVDGELSELDHREVEKAINADPNLSSRVRDLQAVNAKLRGAFDQVIDEPVPARLTAALQEEPGADVVDLATRRADRVPPRDRPTWLQLTGVAATLVLGIVLGRTLDLPDSNGGEPNNLMAVSPPLEAALNTQRSGQQSAPISVALTFRDKNGNFCRSFSATLNPALAGVACRKNGRWQIELVVPAELEPVNDYRLAGSALPPTVLKFVDRHIDGEPLGPKDEQRAAESQWRQ